VSITPPVTGTLVRVPVEVGQDVYAGELLAELSNGKLEAAQAVARLDTEKAQSKVQNLRAEMESLRIEISRAGAAAVRGHAALTTAEKEFVRQRVLDREGATPHLKFLKAQQDYQSALVTMENLDALAQQARESLERVSRELESARANLQDRTNDFNSISTVSEIHAPVDGVIISQQGKVGELVNSSQMELFRIAVDLALLDVVVNADEKTLASVHPGEAATVRIAEGGDSEIPAVVREVASGGMLVGFNSPSPAIRPGMTALVRLAVPPGG
jgi:multidrug resistance efflux pump